MSRSVWLAERLSLPPSVKAILFDMDGVLIDSITLDYNICNDLVRGFIDFDANITRELIRKGFALSAPDFWRWLLKEIAVSFSQSQFHALLSEYEDARRTSSYALNPGISDILEDAAKRGLKMAVVSNNPTGDVATILDKAGILSRFDIINGNDQKALRKKPSPDTYLNAAQRMAVDIAECAIVEDSILGIEAGSRSGAYSIGVATGGDTFEELSASRKAHVCYWSFLPKKIDLQFSDVLVKRIVTPNEFVSHMIEHIAWRLGVAI
ncbi:MAG: HAD family hydrolase, partial [Candidatus Binatia bacterium]